MNRLQESFFLHFTSLKFARNLLQLFNCPPVILSSSIMHEHPPIFTPLFLCFFAIQLLPTCKKTDILLR